MAGRDQVAGAEARRQRRRQRLGQGQNFGPGLRGGSPIAGDDRDAPGGGQGCGGALDIAGVGDRPVRRNAPRLGVDDGRRAGLSELDDIALQAAEIEMGRPRRVGERGAPGVA